jgi:hypothetical protein
VEINQICQNFENLAANAVLKEGEKDKQDAKSEEHIFVGFADNSKAFLYYNAKLQRIMKSCNVILMRMYLHLSKLMI